MFSVKPSDSDLIGAFWRFKIIYKQMGYVCQTSPFGFSKKPICHWIAEWNLRFTTLILSCEKYDDFFVLTYIFINTIVQLNMLWSEFFFTERSYKDFLKILLLWNCQTEFKKKAIEWNVRNNILQYTLYINSCHKMNICFIV